MLSLYLLLIGFCTTSLCSAFPTTTSSGHCNNPPKRLEWRQLREPQKKAYIDAVLCLTRKKEKSGIAGAVNRFDDHQAVHNSQTPAIHWVGHFMLWHRYFVATYEKALRDECGYSGGQPYWDWSQDASPHNPLSTRAFHSAIFSPDHGFGGNGAFIAPTADQNPLNITGGTGGGCVKNGPFAPPAFMLNFPTLDCLRRDFIPAIMNTFADPALVQNVLAQPDYTSFARAVENVPSFEQPNIHGSGHFGVGGVLGTIGNAANSPGDPLFFLHHGNLDRIFWTWQQEDLKIRLKQVGGPIFPFDYSGKNVTLDFTVNMGKLAGNVTLEDLLNTQGKTLCYMY
ncbi:Di-copper centre-containing protein [Dothidotthia symphoricarpi CBS 119687]|uniref:Di-copper centre-containing protein n=1 Tax=Dothidotthia symphoricarpi CBS 119687 TaxID=1392245 RepID=A0A6A6A665_9PLEO|nr:Di-copper centre-containing protein [Dothidotthia symphoricarpi CBS 119687]KAF2127046.1 Di-copper centre-containing protein [Dothidotthia symphoricarpi CBS 119687]